MLDVCGDRGETEITDMMDVEIRLKQCTRESMRRRIWRKIRGVMMMIRMKSRHDSQFDLGENEVEIAM